MRRIRGVRWALGCLVMILGLWQGAHASVMVYDFEAFSDSDLLAGQLPGLTFGSTIVLSTGVSLNEFEFPPKSGFNVVSDNGGPIEILFAAPVTRVGGYFTYLDNLLLTAYDAADQVIDFAASQFRANMALSGDASSSPNEYLELSAIGISRVVFSSSALGGSFVLDDLTVETGAVSIPEPSSGALIGLAIAALGWRRNRSTFPVACP